MKYIILIILLICFQFKSHSQLSKAVNKEFYYCTPCNLACDTMVFEHPGNCPVCNMPLIKKVNFTNSYPSQIKPQYSGHWAGLAKTTDQEIHFSLDIETNPVKILFNSVDLKAMNVTAHNVKVNGDSMQFKLIGDNNITVFKGLLKNNRLTGVCITNDLSVTIQNRTANFELLLAPANPNNYRAQEVTFNNGTVVLAASLYLPDGMGPFAALVCNHSSGDKPRYDGAFMADYLAKRGIAALIYDKRGSGQSTGDWKTASFEDLADDCIAGLKFLQSQSKINPKFIGIFGHSQGATISPIIIHRCPDIAFNIAAAGFAVAPEEQDIFRVTNILKHDTHFKSKVIDSAIRFYKIWLKVAKTGTGWDELEQAKHLAQKSKWYEWVEPPPRDSWVWKWYLNAGNYDFIPYWEKVKIPTLLIYGENDEITPVKPSVANIQSALKKANNQQYKLIIIPKYTHYLALLKKNGDLWTKSNTGYLESIDKWIHIAVSK